MVPRTAVGTIPKSRTRPESGGGGGTTCSDGGHPGLGLDVPGGQLVLRHRYKALSNITHIIIIECPRVLLSQLRDGSIKAEHC